MSGCHASLSTQALVQKLIGVRESRRLYKGRLQPLFSETGPEKCFVARELVRRWLQEEFARGSVLSKPEAVRDYLRIHFAGQPHESFLILYLDAQNRLLDSEELFRGMLTQTSVYPREVVKGALTANAAGVILAHNHPSGLAEPSHADELLTQALKQALSLIDVKVLDHFIVAGNAAVSFAERGLL